MHEVHLWFTGWYVYLRYQRKIDQIKKALELEGKSLPVEEIVEGYPVGRLGLSDGFIENGYHKK